MLPRVTPAVVVLGLVAATPAMAQLTVGDTPTMARADDGQFISWREHIIDEPAIAGFALSGLLRHARQQRPLRRGVLARAGAQRHAPPGVRARPGG